MDNIIFHETPRRRMQDLADSLSVLHDSLIELAMTFRDLQFEIDTVKRAQASVEVEQIVRRIARSQQ